MIIIWNLEIDSKEYFPGKENTSIADFREIPEFEKYVILEKGIKHIFKKPVNRITLIIKEDNNDNFFRIHSFPKSNEIIFYVNKVRQEIHNSGEIKIITTHNWIFGKEDNPTYFEVSVE